MIQAKDSISNFLSKFRDETADGENTEFFSYRLFLGKSHLLSKFHELSDLFDTAFYFRNLNDNLQTAALGNIFSIRELEPDKLSVTGESFERIGNKFSFNYGSSGESLPLFFGGIKFNNGAGGKNWIDFPASEWFLPRFIIVNRNRNSSLIINFGINENTDGIGSIAEKIVDILEESGWIDSSKLNFEKIDELSTDDREWQAKVNYALGKIKDGDLKKVVLSRQLAFQLDEKDDINALLCGLERVFPYCYIFAFKKNNATFFGASPEKLFEINNQYLRTDALAGSISRGRTEKEDLLQIERLKSSGKDIREHKMVLEYIVDILKGFSREIYFGREPNIRTLSNIHHLITPIEAKISAGVSIFSIIENLHPTPAVCGLPTRKAKELISALEDFDRGYFSGVLGWFNLKGDCQFTVGIRSALIKDRKLFTFSGCGIVEGSRAEVELEESNLKLNSIISLFQDENKCKPQ